MPNGRSTIGILVILLGIASALVAQQHRVAPRNLYHRIIVVVPLVGQGTPEDPKRPQYTPLSTAAGSRDGIIAFSQRVSDDGQYAIVELVAADRAAFRELLADLRPDVLVFDRKTHSQLEIEGGIRKYLKDFTLAGFGVNLQ